MKNLWFYLLALLIGSCQNAITSTSNVHQQIAATLEMETQYFCERNIEKWQEQWSHRSFVSKMYTGHTTFKEFVGWEAIKQNTIQHIKDFPEPFPIPDSSQDYTIELFGHTAFVFYSKTVENKLIRETRFMVKEGDKWKIARMQTIH